MREDFKLHKRLKNTLRKVPSLQRRRGSNSSQMGMFDPMNIPSPIGAQDNLFWNMNSNNSLQRSGMQSSNEHSVLYSQRYGENRGDRIRHIAAFGDQSVRYIKIKAGETIEMITWGIGNSDNTQIEEATCGSDGMGLDEMIL